MRHELKSFFLKAERLEKGAKVNHVDRRIAERTPNLQPSFIPALESAANLQSLDPDKTYHAPLPGGGYAVLGVVGKTGRQKHVVKTVLSPHMSPPGTRLPVPMFRPDEVTWNSLPPVLREKIRKNLAKKEKQNASWDPGPSTEIFHGSPKKIDKFELRRHYLADDAPVVFGTPSKAMALSHLSRWSDDDFDLGTVNDGPLTMKEKYPGALEKVYKGKGGFLYQLDPAEFKHSPRLMRSERLSHKAPNILKVEEVKDALQALQDSGIVLEKHVVKTVLAPRMRPPGQRLNGATATAEQFVRRFDAEEKKVRGKDKLLWKDTEGLPVMQIKVDPLHAKYLDKKVWGGKKLSPREIYGGKADPFRTYQHQRLTGEAELKYPIILKPNGRILDGVHRLMKAKQEGRDTIPAVMFNKKAAKAVIIKGNPGFIGADLTAAKFYTDLATQLRQRGYDDVTFDPGKPFTSPPKADLWVGHSRGADRLRFAPPGTKTVDLGPLEHPKSVKRYLETRRLAVERGVPYDQLPLKDRSPVPEHYLVTPAMLAAFDRVKKAAPSLMYTVGKTKKLDPQLAEGRLTAQPGTQVFTALAAKKHLSGLPGGHGVYAVQVPAKSLKAVEGASGAFEITRGYHPAVSKISPYKKTAPTPRGIDKIDTWRDQATSVGSSHLDAIKYDKNSKKLQVLFRSGALYEYDGVSPRRAEVLSKARSKGKYFNDNIRSKPYRYRRLE